MTPFEAYVLFQAIKLHFTSKTYDFVKYGGKLKRDIREFERRKDKMHYARLGRHQDPKLLCVSAFSIPNFSGWVGDLFQPEVGQRYDLLKANIESLSYCILNDISKLDESFVDLCRVTSGDYPKLLTMHNQGMLKPLTLPIIDAHTSIFDMWNKKIADPVIWPNTSRILRKMHAMIVYDRQKVGSIINRRIAEDLAERA